MDKLKDKLKKRVTEIVYEKAKEEFKSVVRNRIATIKKRIRNFFGMGESRKERINRIAEEYKTRKDVGYQNILAGILELYTLNYMKSVAEMISHSALEKGEKLNDKNEES